MAHGALSVQTFKEKSKQRQSLKLRTPRPFSPRRPACGWPLRVAQGARSGLGGYSTLRNLPRSRAGRGVRPHHFPNWLAVRALYGPPRRRGKVSRSPPTQAFSPPSPNPAASLPRPPQRRTTQACDKAHGNDADGFGVAKSVVLLCFASFGVSSVCCSALGFGPGLPGSEGSEKPRRSCNARRRPLHLPWSCRNRAETKFA